MCSRWVWIKHKKNSFTAEEAAVLSGRGTRPEAERKRERTKLKSIALEIVTVSDARATLHLGVCCRMGCSHSRPHVSLWGCCPHVCAPGIYVFTHHPLRVHSFILHVSLQLWTLLSPGDTLPGLMVEGGGGTQAVSILCCQENIAFSNIFLKEPTSRRLVFLILLSSRCW